MKYPFLPGRVWNSALRTGNAEKLVVERLINNRLLLDAAQAAGITPDTVDVEASVLAIVRLTGMRMPWRRS